MVGATRSTIREKRPADPMRRAFRDAASVSTHASPPGSYWYHIGTVSGPRPGPAETDRAAMCGSARNNSRSRTGNLLSAMSLTLTGGTDNQAWAGRGARSPRRRNSVARAMDAKHNRERADSG